jgi:hypothetical protein
MTFLGNDLPSLRALKGGRGWVRKGHQANATDEKKLQQHKANKHKLEPLLECKNEIFHGFKV